MTLTVQAAYENGVLKPGEPLPLREHQRVQVTVQPTTNWVGQTYGICGWTGNPEELRRLALSPEFDLAEEP
jgi:predicted DNA-binding antitoxin AbrB/MazE fold protein